MASKSTPSWTEVKAKLAKLDRSSLIDLIQNLYAASKDNRGFLHARFGLGGDVLKPYKATIERWIWPDVSRNQDTSVAKAKKAITDYKKAVGDAEGLAELMMFYCERAVGFGNEVGLRDDGYPDAFVRMFGQLLKVIETLPKDRSAAMVRRLQAVRHLASNLAFGVRVDMDELLFEHPFDDESP